MQISIQRVEQLQGIINIPASKSEAIRALIFGLLGLGTSHIDNALDAVDVNDAIHACQTLGARITQHPTHITITSSGTPFEQNPTRLYTGNSGITTRFILPLLGLRANTDLPIEVDCADQMRTRPMGALLDALRDLGMKINSLGAPDSLPIRVRGPLLGGITTLKEPISQYLSALLIALPLAANTSQISVMNLPSRPYLNMTLAWLTRLGIVYTHQREKNRDTFIIPGQQSYQPFHYTLPGDFSSASYFIAAGVLFNGKITLKGLDIHDSQGDKQLIDLVQQMGGDIVCENNDIIITGGKPLTGIHIDASQIPDLLPTLAVLGTAAQGKTIIDHVEQARLKETDRIHSMTEGLRRMGARIEEKPDGMIIYPSELTGSALKGYQDHRTVMALTLAGLRATGNTVIDDAESIQKTFPEFFHAMKQLGASLEEIS